MLVNCVVSDDILPAHSLVGVIGGNTVQITAQCPVPVLFKARINYTTFVLNITVPFPTTDEKEKIAVKSSLWIPVILVHASPLLKSHKGFVKFRCLITTKSVLIRLPFEEL